MLLGRLGEAGFLILPAGIIKKEERSVKRLLCFLLAACLLLFAGCRPADVLSSALPAPGLPSPSPLPSPDGAQTAEPQGPSGAENTPAPSPSSGPPAQTPIAPQTPADSELVRVADYIPTIRQELHYATTGNYTQTKIYDFTDAYLRYGTIKKLQQACNALAEQGLGLKIWDGFRPVAAQARLWELCPDPTYVSHPVTGNRTHCRGNTVDVTLVDLATGEELPMPTGYDDFTAAADRDYSDCSPEAAANAQLLETTMESCGFRPYFNEWWHFTDTTDYPVEEFFDPAVPTLWIANCDEFISLRQSPGGAVLLRIPKGGTVKLRRWEGKYAFVRYGGQEGYVLTNYILPKEESYLSDCLETVVPTSSYSYEQLLADLSALKERHPGAVTAGSIGLTELGREIPVLCIGDPDNAEYHVLLQGAIHGREHLTAWLLMALADYWLDHGILGYGSICYHIIPMANPDGVTISQTAALGSEQQAIYQSDRENGYTAGSPSEYAAQWKANGKGVDINRNFPAGWELIESRSAPSSQQYRGSAPFSSREAAALRDYTLRFDFDATISYHATGSLIYYEYGSRQEANALSLSLGQAVSEVTGYELIDSSGVDGAGYKDWAIDELGIPSLTIEVGCEEAALAEREIASIFVRSQRVLPAIAQWLQRA